MAEVTTASVFMSGRSQAVRIPKAFWFDAERVEIRRRGQEVILKPIAKEDQWSAQREAIAMMKKEGLVFEASERAEHEGYPRMRFDESREHFEARVREYERSRKEAERIWGEQNGQ